LRIYPEDRQEYLDYHRNFVFQDDINDLTWEEKLGITAPTQKAGFRVPMTVLWVIKH
jgi:hypothetical protein